MNKVKASDVTPEWIARTAIDIMVENHRSGWVSGCCAAIEDVVCERIDTTERCDSERAWETATQVKNRLNDLFRSRNAPMCWWTTNPTDEMQSLTPRIIALETVALSFEGVVEAP